MRKLGRNCFIASSLLCPTCSGTLSADRRPLVGRQGRRPNLAAPVPQFGGGALSTVSFQFLDFLAGRDPHDLDGVADHIGGALFASEAAGHPRSSSARNSPVCWSSSISRILRVLVRITLDCFADTFAGITCLSPDYSEQSSAMVAGMGKIPSSITVTVPVAPFCQVWIVAGVIYQFAVATRFLVPPPGEDDRTAIRNSSPTSSIADLQGPRRKIRKHL